MYNKWSLGGREPNHKEIIALSKTGNKEDEQHQFKLP